MYNLVRKNRINTAGKPLIMRFSAGMLVIAKVFQTESVPLKSFNKLTCEIKYFTG